MKDEGRWFGDVQHARPQSGSADFRVSTIVYSSYSIFYYYIIFPIIVIYFLFIIPLYCYFLLLLILFNRFAHSAGPILVKCNEGRNH